MWAAVARSGLALAVCTFLMWVLVRIISPMLTFATSGPHSDASSVQRIGDYFSALQSLDNLVLIAALAVGVYLLGRAAVERRLTP